MIHSNISTVLVLGIAVRRHNGIDGLEKCDIDVLVAHFCHCEAYIIPIATQVVFETGECELDWVEVRGVGWQVFAAHSSVK
jgi:hypothetical protein